MPALTHLSCAAVPPELLASGVLSKAADVYSFGVLMVELWSQSRAWAGASICLHHSLTNA